MEQYKSDLYLFISCTQSEQKWLSNVHDEEGQKYIEELEKTARYEFDTGIFENINRTLLGRITLVCKDDNRESPSINGNQDAFLVVTTYKRANIHLLTIVISDVEVNHTFLLDQASRNELIVLVDGNETLFIDWVKEAYGFVTMGKAYSASCVSKLVEPVAPYLLAAESYHEDAAMRIASPDIERLLQQNVAQYSIYEAYLSPSSLLYVMHDYPENFVDRLYVECLMVFIMELVVLQITAIGCVNKIIIEKLNAQKEISLQDILKLYELFAATMPLWDIRKFRYDIAQTFADKVSESFKVDVLMNTYEKNRKMLEDLERVKGSISSEKESKILNVVATSLAIIQVLPLGYAISLYLFEGNSVTLKQYFSLLSISALILLPIGILRLRKLRK
ncbi:hypothetical protein [Paenibacillus sp. YIM B09110]|uniref:hypothetical protein n=1 Tax=Paenibacillus sp. YIM B09110 TaxID=3126102 RepID=UPI00301D499B